MDRSKPVSRSMTDRTESVQRGETHNNSDLERQLISYGPASALALPGFGRGYRQAQGEQASGLARLTHFSAYSREREVSLFHELPDSGPQLPSFFRRSPSTRSYSRRVAASVFAVRRRLHQRIPTNRAIPKTIGPMKFIRRVSGPVSI